MLADDLYSAQYRVMCGKACLTYTSKFSKIILDGGGLIDIKLRFQETPKNESNGLKPHDLGSQF